MLFCDYRSGKIRVTLEPTMLCFPCYACIHCKKRFAIFPSTAVMSLTKHSLDGNNLTIPAQGEFGQ